MKRRLPDRYCYPAVFTYYGEGKEIAVTFPDLGCATSGVDDQDALFSAKELLELTMFGMEEDGVAIPTPSRICDISHKKNETVALIDIFMPSVRMGNENKAVKRTVTLPAWMNARAMELGVNFSQVLQEALREKMRLA